MRLVTLAAICAAFLAGTAAGADMSRGNTASQPGPWTGYGPAGQPPLYPVNPPRPQVHPGARGYVHNPVWRHPVRVAGHRQWRFHYGGHRYVVLAGPVFVAPWQYYPTGWWSAAPDDSPD
jgi:hypothetical protein